MGATCAFTVLSSGNRVPKKPPEASRLKHSIINLFHGPSVSPAPFVPRFLSTMGNPYDKDILLPSQYCCIVFLVGVIVVLALRVYASFKLIKTGFRVDDGKWQF